MAGTFTIEPKGPFSLEAVSSLQCGFLRGTRACNADRATVKLAFPLDGSFEITGVALRLTDGRLEGAITGNAAHETVRRQVARVLALDHDATGFARILKESLALAKVAAERPDFRPVVSQSPYVMGGWAVLSQRLRMNQAAAIQVRLAEAVGAVVEIEGDPVASFPAPRQLLAMKGFPGVAAEKWARLLAVARAADEGELEIERLLAVPYAEARKRLMAIRGVGPWTADAILMRGCGPVDVLPLSEPTLHEAVRAVYGLAKSPSDAEVEKIAEEWVPFRMWVSVLLISHAHTAGTIGKGKLRRG